MKCVYHYAKKEREKMEQLIEISIYCREDGARDCTIQASGYKTVDDAVTAASNLVKTIAEIYVNQIIDKDEVEEDNEYV